VTAVTGPLKKDIGPDEEAAPDVRTRVTEPPVEGHALEVTGDSDFLVYLAKCCKPLPGEEIVGFVTRGKGVAVHGRECPNVRNLMYHPEREIEVRWAPSRGSAGAPTSQVDLDMTFEDGSGMLASISMVISSEGSDILNCQLRSERNERGFAALTILVHDAAQLSRIITRLNALKGMVRVERRGS
jgi:GTP pyrophosphokinase